MANATGSVQRLSDLIMLLDPAEAAKLTRPLTADEEAAIDDMVARHGGSHAAALGVRDPQLAAEVDALMSRR